MGIAIGLHAAKGSGKDQFYKAVKQAFPELDIQKIAYADPVRFESCKILGLNNESEYDTFKRSTLYFNLDDGTPREISGRQIVREIGMTMLKYDQNQYIQYVEDRITKYPDPIWIITDVRFPSESLSVKSILNGTLVKIKRNGFEYDGHVTETEIPDNVCDIVLENDNITLEQYNKLAVETFSKILNNNKE